MAITYESISTQTLSVAAASITFSSIPATYTDLVLIVNGGISSATQSYGLRFNSDSATNYSYTFLSGDGATASTGRYATQNFIPLSWNAASTTVADMVISHINNYSNTTTYKTVLSRHSNAALGVDDVTGLWRSTSAVSTILVYATSGNLVTGSTFTLYGIKAA